MLATPQAFCWAVVCADVEPWTECWGERRDLNPRPSVPQTDALPAELRSPPFDCKQFSIVFSMLPPFAINILDPETAQFARTHSGSVYSVLNLAIWLPLLHSRLAAGSFFLAKGAEVNEKEN